MDRCKTGINSLFIAYYGIEEALIQSQGIPYLRELSKKGINFTILSFQKKLYSKEKEREIFRKIRKELDRYAIKWYYLRYHKEPSLLVTPFDILCGFFYSLYIIIKEKINVLHPRASLAGVMVFPLAIIFRLKYICDIRGLLAREYAEGGRWPKNSPQYFIMDFFERIIPFIADAVVVLTHELKRLITQEKHILLKKNREVTVIPCCVDLDKFKFNPDKNLPDKSSYVYIYVGSIGNWYLTEEMIDFLKVAKHKNQNSTFIILCNNDIPLLKRIIERKGLNIADFIIGNVFHEEVPNYLRQADIGLIFDKPGFSRKANSPTKLAEYLAMGLPVVVNYGIGDTEEIIFANNIGVIIRNFTDRDYAEAVDKLTELAKDKELRVKCLKVARERFSLESGAEKYLGIYRGLFNKAQFKKTK